MHHRSRRVRTPSISARRIRRPRVAPSAARMAVSRSRVTPRERSRLATFTHAINTTKLTAASSDHRSGWSLVPGTIVRLEFRMAVFIGTTRTVRPVLESGNSRARSAAMAFISCCACSTVTPGFSRPSTIKGRP